MARSVFGLLISLLSGKGMPVGTSTSGPIGVVKSGAEVASSNDLAAVMAGGQLSEGAGRDPGRDQRWRTLHSAFHLLWYCSGRRDHHLSKSLVNNLDRESIRHHGFLVIVIVASMIVIIV